MTTWQEKGLRALREMLSTESLAQLVDEGSSGNGFFIHYLAEDDEMESLGQPFDDLCREVQEAIEPLPEETRKRIDHLLRELNRNRLTTLCVAAENVLDVLVRWYLRHHHGIVLPGRWEEVKSSPSNLDLLPRGDFQGILRLGISL